jgi:hypothetical protein
MTCFEEWKWLFAQNYGSCISPFCRVWRYWVLAGILDDGYGLKFSLGFRSPPPIPFHEFELLLQYFENCIIFFFTRWYSLHDELLLWQIAPPYVPESGVFMDCYTGEVISCLCATASDLIWITSLISIFCALEDNTNQMKCFCNQIIRSSKQINFRCDQSADQTINNSRFNVIRCFEAPPILPNKLSSLEKSRTILIEWHHLISFMAGKVCRMANISILQILSDP